MSERAEDDVRSEQRRAARQPRQHQRSQQGEAYTAMATAGERRALPSPKITPGQPWSDWVDAAKLHGNDGAETEESLKDSGKNREAMRLCRDDMPIFGQCPAQDDFYLVMCSHCGQVVKPQAFQAHYERRHGSSSKLPSALLPATVFPLPVLPNRSRGDGSGRPSNGNSSSNSSKIPKVAKDKLPVHPRPPINFKVLPDKITSTATKVDKAPAKPVDASAKLGHAPSSSTTVSSKPSLTCPSIPKPPLLSPGQIPNGRPILSSLDKKQEDNASYKRHKRISEREFNADFHCGVLDVVTRKPCTRSLTCKTHSLNQRRAVLGRRKRFDTLLAEHKSKAREKELQRSTDYPQQTPPLRDPHPSPVRMTQDPSPGSHSSANSDARSLPSKSRPHNPSLPRALNYSSQPCGNGQGDPVLVQETSHPSTAAPEGVSRLSSDEGENEEREENMEKLDCHYSGYHPRPAAFCSFGSRQLGRSCYRFDRCWDRLRCALSDMVDRHVNAMMWKKIPPASEMVSASGLHRASTNSHPVSHYSGNGGVFLCPASSSSSPALLSPPYAQPLESKSILSYGTTLSARVPSTEPPARHTSLWPQVPSGQCAVPSLVSSRSPKPKPSSKPFRCRESSGSTINSSSSSVGSGKKRKSASPLPGHPPSSVESSPSSSSSSSSSSTFKKNSAVTPGGSGNIHHQSLTSSFSSHGGIHNAGLNCAPGRTNPVSLKQEPSGKGPASGSPAESIKRMSVVMNSSDSTLSLGPFVHQAAESAANSHTGGRLEGKRRKGSLPSRGDPHRGSPGPGRPIKLAKSPLNNVHGKHSRGVPGTQGLPSNTFIQQPKARP